MVSSKLLLLYTRTWGYIMKDGGPSEDDIGKFSETLPSLKSCLTCTVCRSLLRGDSLYSPSVYSDGDRCDHFVCKECKGGRREENLRCKSCEDWNFFSEDETLILLLKGYRQFCKYFLRSQQCTSVLEIRHQDETSFDGNKTLTLLVEGAAQYKPDVKVPMSRSGRSYSRNVGVNQSNVTSVLEGELIFGGSAEDEGECDSEEDYGLECDVESAQDPLAVEVQRSNVMEEIKMERADEEESEEDDECENRTSNSPVIKIEDESCGGADMDDEDFQDEGEECDMQDDSSIKVTESSAGRTYVHRVVEIVRETQQNPEQDPLGFEEDEELMDDENEDDENEDDDFESSTPIEEEVQLPKQFTIQRFTDLPVTSRIQTPQTVVTDVPPQISSSCKIVQTSAGLFTSASSVPTMTSSQQPMQMPPQRITHSIVLTRPPVSVGSVPPKTNQSPVTVRLPTSTSSIRLANFGNLSLGSGGLHMVRQMIGGQVRTIALPAELANKKIIVRPISTTNASNVSIQNLPDGKKIIHYSPSGPFITSSGGISSTASMFQHFTSTSSYTTASNTPPPVQSISSESRDIHQPAQQVASFNLNSIGVANPGFSGATSVSVRPTSLTTSSGAVLGTIGSVMGSSNDPGSPGTIRKLKVQVPGPAKVKPKLSPKLRKGCRCGNAATQPGKLTCCGQRCPCYVEAKSCVDCRCKGCKNPYLPGGKKLLQGINAVVDTKTNTTVPMGVTIANLGSTVGSSSTNVMPSSNIPMSSAVTAPTMNFVPVSLASGINTGQTHQIFGRIHPQGGLQTHQGATFSQLIPISNFGVGGFTTIPISIFPPLMSQHPDGTQTAVQIHNVQSLASLQQHKIIKPDTHEGS